MTKMVKLNLGCGIYYKPGYVNIDKFENLVADLQADLFSLPYSDNSVDEIEASHILEHFDIIHVPYLLAEWWRVLKSGGVVHIEVPHLRKSTRNVRFRSISRNLQTIRFLFGVDLPGNFHKSGFTGRILKTLLEHIGFVRLKREKQQSFHSESGLRIRAEKSEKKINLIAEIRLQILKAFPPPQLELYSAIESNIMHTLQSASLETLTDLICDFSIFHPYIAKIIVSLFPQKRKIEINEKFLEFLDDHDFPTLLYLNWEKWTKFSKNISVEFKRFLAYWRERFSYYIKSSAEYEKEFLYLTSLDVHSIQESVPFLSMEYITIASQKVCNQGLKAFNERKMKIAKLLFTRAMRINPSNELAYWNLARIYGHENNRKKSLENYKTVQELLQNKKYKKILMHEISRFTKTLEIPEIPIQIRY